MPRTSNNGSSKGKTIRHQNWQAGLRAMMEPSTSEPGTELDVGSRLRALRAEKSLSIRSLAELSGLNFNTLSLIENDKTSPSVSTLQLLARALQVPITAFFETSQPKREIVFQENGQRPHASFTHGKIEDLGGGLSLGIGIPLQLTLEPGADSGKETIVHTGQEFVYCLEGQLFYEVSGKEHKLKPGDSLIFQAYLPHRWMNDGQIRTRFILVLCPGENEDISTGAHFPPRETDVTQY